MTHQNHQTNGASLEDCHTNFFALTELYGIKWRKLVWGETPNGGGGGGGGETDGSAPLADPVISSYARCLAGDILCVWRRVPAPQQDIYDVSPPTPPPLSLRAAKELWIFWYGEEPDLSGLVAPELLASQGEQGSWESGLSYECRSLLFKALHNLIERCLLSRDFVRLGKWFVQPYDGDEEDVENSPWHLSFSFAFFLHGESTVCASVDVRQHPPVRALAPRRRRAAAALAPPEDTKVILAPFGLEGTTTGREWSDDPATLRLLDAWRQLYPLDQAATAVEVICGGVRMRYPSRYALRTRLTPARAEPPAVAAALTERAVRALAMRLPHQGAELCGGDEDFVDPTRKAACTCAKWRRRRSARLVPFHRRQLRQTHPSGGAAGGAGAACSPASCGGASPGAPASAPSSAGAPPASPHLPPAHQAHQGSAQVPTSLHTPAPTPDPLAPPTPAPPPAPPNKLNYQQSDSPYAAPERRATRPPSLGTPERAPGPHDDEHSLRMLYDYSTVHAWLEHPVKRFKPDEPSFREEMALGACAADDLYAGHDHTKMAAHPHHSDVKVEKHEHNEDKEYKNLFTSNGLCPTLKDLDQIFDNSDDASGDEALQVQTPPDSIKSLEEGRCRPRPEELSKMFPTPPSMEPSPGFTPHDVLPERTTPPPEPIEDWSYVFKPPTICKYVGSSKYAPLAPLPSALLPPAAAPAHAVYRPRARDAKEQERQRHRTGTKRGPPLPPPTPTPAGAPRAASPAPARAAPPACPVLLNVLLADTVLNVFRDHNFDSCTLCVCNAGPKVVGNIRGADAATYLPEWAGEDPARCSCGFSAVVNRRLSHQAGLFYEDEMEITGIADPPLGSVWDGAAWARWAGDAGPPGAGACALARAAAAAAPPHDPLALNKAEYTDGGSAAALALRAAGGAAGGAACAQAAAGAVHRWPFIGARGPRSSRDVVRLMRRLRPLLQDAIQKRCCGARMWDGVTGPLTWRQFHRLAGRGNEDLCEPQPVPTLLVGHARDWLALSPYAVRHWARLGLEPYAYTRDVFYVALAPAGRALDEPLRAFFKELSTEYESCRLGRHQPLQRVAPDGLVRPAPADKDWNSDDWTGPLPPGRIGDHIRAYAEVLDKTLIQQLKGVALDASLFEADSKPAADGAEPAPAAEEEQGACGGWASEAGEAGAPTLVLYVVEPPAAHAHRAQTLLALLRLAAKIQEELPHHCPLVKMISLEGVCESWGLSGGARGEERALAFSVFTQTRRRLRHSAKVKSLTGFGADLAPQKEKNTSTYHLYTPLYVLAATKRGATADEWGARCADAAGVLFLSYCLSHDQRWLLASATDARGELLDTTAINVHVPHRSRRRRAAPARRLGLTKLMDFILGVMSQSAQPWRLVVGRVGRIGHGELKGWSWLLSRKNLARASSMLREVCGSCSVLHPAGVPCILSACLVSTEPDSCLRLMADRFTPDERFSQASIQSHLHTPRDVTATHILVFPTSATTQSNQMPFEAPMANGEDNDMMFLGVDMGDEDMGEDNMTELFIGDMFSHMWAQGSPRRNEDEPPSREGSPARARQSSAQAAADDSQEAVGGVLQQPLALGYLVSTAPLGAMPAWWWAGGAHLRDACPAFLKTALHLHAAALQSDDLAPQSTHPLDSQLTTDVLRYVLEGYNALSWLALDSTTHDRRSCLPLHVQVLMQLYHTAAALG